MQLRDQRHGARPPVLERVEVELPTAVAREDGPLQPKPTTGHRDEITDLKAGQLSPTHPGRCEGERQLARRHLRLAARLGGKPGAQPVEIVKLVVRERLALSTLSP